MAVLDIALFGGLAARLPSGAPLALPSKKSSLLLAYLAMRPDGQATREQAIALLWSDRAEAQARASMRQELVALRKCLGGLDPCPLQIEGERLSLDPGSISVDAVEFARLCRAGSVAELEAALALYRGEFLAGAQVRDPAAEEWLRAERARLRDLLLHAFESLLAHHAGTGAVAPAMDIGCRLLAEDPLREDAHRAMMALLAAAGRRGQALRQYESCRDLIQRELKVELEPRTSRLAQRIRELGEGGAEDQASDLLRGIAKEFAGAIMPASGATGPAALMPTAFASGPPAIAVLPFTSLGGEPGLDLFGDGLVEGVTAALSRVRSFFVIARASTQRYRNQPVDAPSIGAELGVRYLLLGSLQQAGPRIRVSAQLVETGASAMLWSERYDGALEDVFDLQDRITERIVGAIAPSVRMAEIERARRKRPDSLAAYDYVMRALPQIWAMSRAANAEAMRLAYEAIRLDPYYALAHAYASWCHFWGFTNNWTDSVADSRAEALRLVRAALRLDGNDPAVLSIAALSETAIDHDLKAAASYIEKALALDPNFAWGWNRSGYIQVYRDRIATALEHFDRAARLSPFDPLNFNRYVGMALAHYCAGRYEEAVRLAEQARIERPGLPWAYRVLAAAQAELGQMAAAGAALQILLRDSPDLTVARVMESMPFERADIAARFAAGLAAAGMPE